MSVKKIKMCEQRPIVYLFETGLDFETGKVQIYLVRTFCLGKTDYAERNPEFLFDSSDLRLVTMWDGQPVSLEGFPRQPFEPYLYLYIYTCPTDELTYLEIKINRLVLLRASKREICHGTLTLYPRFHWTPPFPSET